MSSNCAGLAKCTSKTYLNRIFMLLASVFQLYHQKKSSINCSYDFVSTVLDLWFDCARPMIGLCSYYVLTLFDLCFDCALPMFWLSRPKLGVIRLLCRPMEFQSQNCKSSIRVTETTIRILTAVKNGSVSFFHAIMFMCISSFFSKIASSILKFWQCIRINYFSDITKNN